MATKIAHDHIGEYDCWSCGKPTPVKQTASGRLSAPCTWCDFSHYALPGTKHHANLMAKVRLYPKTEAPPAGTGKAGDDAGDKPKPKAPPAAAKMPWMR